MTGRARAGLGPALAGLLLIALVSTASEGRDSRGALLPLEPGEAPNRIEFVGTTPLTTVRGRFERWRVLAVEVDPAHLESSFIEVEVDIASVSTGAYRRDDHLRASDFFEVAKYPTAVVKVHSARRAKSSSDGRAHYRAAFVIEIKGNRRTVEGKFVIVLEDPLTVEGDIELDRVAFGVGAPPTRWNPLSIHARIPIHFRAVLAGPMSVAPETGS